LCALESVTSSCCGKASYGINGPLRQWPRRTHR